jgi:hypothetical protein
MVICPLLSGVQTKDHDTLQTVLQQGGGNHEGRVLLANCKQCPHHQGHDPHEHTISCDQSGETVSISTVTR